MKVPPSGSATSPWRWKRRPTPLNSASAFAIAASANAGLAADRDRGKRVLHVVHAGQVELDRQVGAGGAGGDEAHASCGVRDVDRAHLRVGLETIGDGRLGDRGQDVAHIDVVDTEHRDAVERQALHEIDERILEAREVVAVGRHVIGIDIGHDGNDRLQHEE